MAKLKNTPQNKLIISGISVIIFAAIFSLIGRWIENDTKLIIAFAGIGAGVGLLASFLIMPLLVDMPVNISS